MAFSHCYASVLVNHPQLDTLVVGRAMLFAALLCCCSVVLAAQPNGPSLAPAPYLAPSIGTTRVFTRFSQKVTRVAGWRTEYTDGFGRRGALLGAFISDRPGIPAESDSGKLRELWPLKVGKQVLVELQSFPEIQRWKLVVSATERLRRIIFWNR